MRRHTTKPRLKPYDADAGDARKAALDFAKARHQQESDRQRRASESQRRIEAARRAAEAGRTVHDPISTRSFHYTNPEKRHYQRMVAHAERELSLRHALAPRIVWPSGQKHNWWAKPLAIALVALGIGFVMVVSLNEFALLMQQMAAKF